MHSCGCKGAAEFSDMFGGIVACVVRAARRAANIKLRLGVPSKTLRPTSCGVRLDRRVTRVLNHGCSQRRDQTKMFPAPREQLQKGCAFNASVQQEMLRSEANGSASSSSNAMFPPDTSQIYPGRLDETIRSGKQAKECQPAIVISM
jgi:hypothetical protein